MRASTEVCRRPCRDPCTQVLVCRRACTLDPTALLRSAFPLAIWLMVQMTLPLCALGSSLVSEGSMGACVLTNLLRMKETAPQTPQLGACLAQYQEPVVHSWLVPSRAGFCLDLQEPVSSIHELI